mmetsp:Transcript_54249/g.100279  ORF Transcript_54249/g.100279 Transcript_54249/m.100279 type:complete len:298 (+) Transcript_54249:110-1003(+)
MKCPELCWLALLASLFVALASSSEYEETMDAVTVRHASSSGSRYNVAPAGCSSPSLISRGFVLKNLSSGSLIAADSNESVHVNTSMSTEAPKLKDEPIVPQEATEVVPPSPDNPFWMPETFTDFHDGGGPMVELVMRDLGLRELHVRARGSITRFLLSLRKELAEAGEVPEERIGIREVFGRYQLSRVAVQPANQDPDSERQREEVVVRLEVLGGDNPIATDLLDKWREMLHNEQSPLRTGPLKAEFANADLLPSRVSVLRPEPEDEQHGATRLSSMALPIGISAVFTGILIWLAAW